MYLSNIASIGRTVLTKALGLQKDTVKRQVYMGKEIANIESGCYDCEYFTERMHCDELPPHIKEATLQHCASCPNAIFSDIYDYVKPPFNDGSAKFSHAPRLPKNSLKLFLLYHFLTPDHLGTLQDLSTLDLAEIMHCSPQTVFNSNEILINYGYLIEGRSEYCRCLTLCLNDYHNYHERDEYGEAGYITLTKDILLKLMKLPVNALRLALRAYLALDSAAQEAIQTGKTFTYKELHSYLPEYCHPNIVKKALGFLKEIFNISISDRSTDIILSEKQNPHQTIEKDKQKAIKELKTSYFWQKNATDRERADFLELAIEHSYQKVKEAFNYVQKYKVQTEYLGYWLLSFIKDPIPIDT